MVVAVLDSRGAQELDGESDHDLLLGGVVASVVENRAAGEKWRRLLAYFERRRDDDGARHAGSEHFALTARQQTVVEVGELWGMAEGRVRSQLNVVLCLSEHFGYVWGLCQEGSLDAYRATIIADAARHDLRTEEEYAVLARRLDAFLARRLKLVPGVEQPVVCCTVKQLRNKLSYEVRKLRAADAEERFRRGYEAREVTGSDGEDGISWLTISATTDQVQLARQRLTLAAKSARAAGDERTLDQLRSDLALELLTTGTAPAPGLEALPGYARPVVNLTVPIQTVMGLGDDPGVLSGGTVIPAGLARMIAQRPGATWHRMLTDPAGKMVELSTTRYAPTPAIWEQVVAEHTTCFRSGCDAASTQAELDHRERWPGGSTTPTNLWPACKTDHKAKHAPGFSITQNAAGSFVLRTPAGFEHEVVPAVHPASQDWGPDVPRAIQYSATEVRRTLRLVQFNRGSHPATPAIAWEHDLPVG